MAPALAVGILGTSIVAGIIWGSVCGLCGLRSLLAITVAVQLPLIVFAVIMIRSGERRRVTVGTTWLVLLCFELFLILPDLKDRIQRSKMMETYVRMGRFSDDGLGSVRGASQGTALCDTPELRTFLRPDTRCTDGWGNPYRVWLTATESYIVSFGECGQPDVTDPSLYPGFWGKGTTSDIVLRRGLFFQFPEGKAPGDRAWEEYNLRRIGQWH